MQLVSKPGGKKSGGGGAKSRGQKVGGKKSGVKSRVTILTVTQIENKLCVTLVFFAVQFTLCGTTI